MRILILLTVLLSSPDLWAEVGLQDYVSRFWTQSGTPPAVLDEALTQSALGRARVLAAAGMLSHADTSGRGPGAQMASEGLGAGEYGEVLGAGADLAAVWQAWLNSPAHRAVLAASWEKWGWARAPAPGTVVWVLRFWRR